MDKKPEKAVFTRYVYRIMLQQPGRVSRKRLCELTGCGWGQIDNYIRDEGYTMRQLQKRATVAKTRRFLQGFQTGQPVYGCAAIARTFGYHRTQAFSMAFKRASGQSFAEFRKRYMPERV